MPNQFTPISTSPSQDDTVRRATRVLATALELHKAGYQRLRVIPGRSINGDHWMAYFVPANMVHGDGWTPRTVDGTLLYSTKKSNDFFGLLHTSNDNARALARKLVAQFPELCVQCTGADWPYSGWLVEVLGRAEHGHLPALFGSYGFDHSQRNPPPPPPPADIDGPRYIGTGYAAIPHTELTLADLPASNADFDRLSKFCLSFDGYREAVLTGVDLGDVAEQTRGRCAEASIGALRMTAFYYQRAIKWSDEWPPSVEHLAIIRRVIEEIRVRLSPQRV